MTDTSSTKAFKENYLCESVPNTETADCKTFSISAENKSTHACVENTEKDHTHKCKEINLCSIVPLPTGSDEVDCSKYPVSEENAETHSCIKATSGSYACKEEFMCEKAETGDSDDDCVKYPVDLDKKDTHICIKNDGEGPVCKEELLCSKAQEGASDYECKKYPVSPEKKAQYGCIKNPAANSVGCIEEKLCTSVIKEADVTVDCSKYPLSDANKLTHACVAVTDAATGSAACKEEEILCKTAKNGENNEQCSHYKISAENSENYKCIKNFDTAEDAAACIEQLKCELQTTGATDEICSKLAVDDDEQETCVKNGDKCTILTYCEYGIETSDEVCANYALKNKNNKCVKKSDEDKCEEVAKSTGKGNSGKFLELTMSLLLIIQFISLF